MCVLWRAMCLSAVFIAAPAYAVDLSLLPQATLANTLLSTPKVRGIAEVYNQKIAYMLPKGFVPGQDYDDGKAYSVELLPADHEAVDWKTRVVITGYRNVADIENMSATVFSKNILKPRENCKALWFARDLGARTIDGYEAHAVMTGCGAIRAAEYPGAITGAGEVQVTLIVQGLHDMFTMDINLRGHSFAAGSLPVAVDIAGRLIDYFNPTTLCAASMTTAQCATRQQEVARGVQ